MEQDALGWSLDRQATKDEGAGSKAETLGGGSALQPNHQDGFQLPEPLLGSQQAGMVLSEDHAGPFHHHTSRPPAVYGAMRCATLVREAAEQSAQVIAQGSGPGVDNNCTCSKPELWVGDGQASVSNTHLTAESIQVLGAHIHSHELEVHE